MLSLNQILCMSKKRNTLLLLNDIVDAISAIEDFIAKLTQEEFYNDRKTKDAVVRNFEIIGEASRQISSEFKSDHPRIKWQETADLRNKIIHEYFGVELCVTLGNNYARPFFFKRKHSVSHQYSRYIVS